MKMRVMVAAAALVSSAGMASASSVLANIGFEASEGYVLGDLFGQNGWTDTGSVANVTGVRAASGTRSVSIDSSPIPSAAWWWPSVNYDTAATSDKTVVASVDMYLDSAGANSANWGLDCYDGNSPFGRVSALWINSTGFANYWNGSTSVATSTSVAYDRWNNLKISMNYATLKASFAINGVTIASGIPLTAGISTVFGDADFNVQGAGFDTTFFDNYRIEAVPTPGVLGLFGLGALAAGRRRRA